MFSIFQTIALFLIAISAYGQLIVKGKVQGVDGQPLAFANALILNSKDSSLVTGAVVDESGLYTFDGLKPGYYLVAVRMMGYRPSYSSPFNLISPTGTHQLPPLVALADEKQLREVIVTASKPPFEQHVDKLVVNPAGMITAAGGTVLDVLERSPGLRVDRQNGAITLSGREGVMVMINGKLSRLPLETLVQMLGGMNVDNVEKIELISNPPAKYDAEGNAGLINIVLKRRPEEGTNGNFAIMAGYGKYEKAGGSFNVNHNQGRVNLFANASYNYNNRWFDFLAKRTQPVQGELWHNIQYSDRYLKNYNGDFRLGADVVLGKQTVLSAQVQGLLNNRKGTSFNTSSTQLLTAAQPFTEMALRWVEDNRWRNLGGMLGLTHSFGKGQSINIDADYQHYNNNGPFTLGVTRFYSNKPQIAPVQSVNTIKQTAIDFWVLKANYIHPISKGWKLETGAKFNRSDINNVLGVEKKLEDRFITDTAMTNTALFYENIGAVHGSLAGKIGLKTDLQAGLRAEATHTNIRSLDGQPLLDRKNLNLFPSASFSQHLSPQHTLNLTFSRRITRPSYTDLAPSFFLTEPNTYFVGNINLKPAFTSNFRAGYQFKSRYFLWAGYSRERNSIFRYQPVMRPGRPELIHITQNFDLAEVLSLELNFPLELTAWWKAQNNLSGFIRTARTQFDIAPFYQRKVFGSVNSVHSFRLGSGWDAEVNFSYRSHIPFGVMNHRSTTNLILGVKKILPNNWGGLVLNINDILWTNQSRVYVSFPEQQISFKSTLRDAPRIIQLTYTRSLGSMNIKAARDRRETSEEKKRISF